MHIINRVGMTPCFVLQQVCSLRLFWQMVFGLFGAALLAFDTERALTSAQTARAIAALSLLLVVTWSYEFGTIMSHFRQAAGSLAAAFFTPENAPLMQHKPHQV